MYYYSLIIYLFIINYKSNYIQMIHALRAWNKSFLIHKYKKLQ